MAEISGSYGDYGASYSSGSSSGGRSFDQFLKEQRYLRKSAPREIRKAQRAQIVGTVQGAKRTGLHPLFALGNAGTSSPVQVAGASDPQQNPTRVTMSNKGISPAEEAGIRLADAQAGYWREKTKQMDNAYWQFENSKTSRLRSRLNFKQDGGLNKDGRIQMGNTSLDPIKARPTGSSLDDINKYYGDEVGDGAGIARAIYDWYDQRFKPAWAELRDQADYSKTDHPLRLKKAIKILQDRLTNIAKGRRRIAR